MSLKASYLAPIALFFAVFVSHSACRVANASDSIWSLFAAESLVKEGDLDLNEYRPLIRASRSYGVRYFHGSYYNYFPVGASLVAVPWAWVFDKRPELFPRILPWAFSAKNPQEALTLSSPETRLSLEKLVASFCIALTALMIYLTARISQREIPSLIFALIFAFCTSAWSVGSRSLWQHGPSMMMLSIALFVLANGKRRPEFVSLAGFPLAFAYITRPTNSVSLVIFTLFVLIYYREALLRYLLWVSVVLVPFVLSNLSIYGRWLPPYFRPKRIASNPHFFEALAGNLISPNRGLLVFCPIFLLLAVVLTFQLRRKSFTPLQFAVLLAIALHWIAISSFSPWWGGHSYGPRLFSDMTPYLIFLLFPLAEMMNTASAKSRNILLCTGVLLAAASFFIHYRGATSFRVQRWNISPRNVDQHPERVWDFGDLQIRR